MNHLVVPAPEPAVPPHRRPRRSAAPTIALAVAAVAAAAGVVPAEAATVHYTAKSLSVVVSGSTVTAETTVAASADVHARHFGVCVRSSSGAGLDFPKVAASVSTRGTAFTSTAKTFAPGTYSYFACLYAGGRWTNVGAPKTFVVGAATPAAPRPTLSVVTGNGKVTLRWTGVPGATGFRVGRGGADTSGSGAWSTTDPAGARSRVFDRLVNGTRYTFFVEPVVPGSARHTITGVPSAAPSTPGPTPQPPTPGQTGARQAGGVPLVGKSKMAWNSVVFSDNTTTPTAFETWRGRPVDGVFYFPGRRSWAEMGALPPRRAGDLMVYSIPPFPEAIGGSNAKVGAGAYDAQIRALALTMKTAGWNTDRTVIRLGWENNGSWYQWGQDRGGSAAYKAAFRRFVTQSRAAGLTRVKWDWNLNKGTQAYNARTPWTSGYPGDDVVDIIGLDPYDMWTPSFTEAQWQANITSKNPGLQEVADFARAHDKQMAVDEWGVVHDSFGGGDNPFYVAKMFGFLKANADVVAYDNTYDDDGAPSTWQHKLSDGDNPRAAAQYRKPYPQGWGG